MADKSIQLEDPITGEKVYPITLTDNIYLPNGTPLMKYLNALPFPLGTLIHSTSILKNAGLHMADGGELMIGGVYDDFCQYVIANPSEFPILYDDEDLTVEGAKTALEKWQEEFVAYGQCGKYVITDTYVKLPAITKLSGGLVSTEMTKIASMNEAGLPNITGSLRWLYGYASSQYGTGAFSKTATRNGADGNTGSRAGDFDFDASRSSPIYGKSNTVETEYIKYPYYIVVATVTKTDIEVNIDNVATELNNKIGKNECVRYPVSKWQSSDGLSWYIVYNDEWKEAGGIGTFSSGTKAITHGLTFKTADYIALCLPLSSNGNASCYCSARTVTTATFGQYGTPAYKFSWYVCGK